MNQNDKTNIIQAIINKGTHQQRHRILHVDDNDDFADLFGLTFKYWFDIKTASDGHQALSLLMENDYDAVVIDFDMPGMNGLELLRLIRQKDTLIPVVFYTGQGNEEIAREAFLSGASDYFSKDLSGFAHREKFVNSINKAIEKRKTEDALKREKFKAKEYLDIAAVMMVIIDADGKLSMINKKGCKILGFENDEEIIGKSWFETFVPSSVMLETKKHFTNLMKGDIKTFADFESYIQTKRGEKKLIAWHSTILRDQTGKSEALLCSGEDITDRKISEEKIKESEKRLNQIIHQMPYPILVCSLDGKVEMVNQSALDLFGTSSENLILDKFNLFDNPILSKSEYEQKFLEVYSGKSVFIPELSINLGDYQQYFDTARTDTIVMEATLFPVFHQSGKIWQTVMILRDIREQKYNKEHVNHLNLVLKAVKNIAQITLHEKEKEMMISEICRSFTKEKCYKSSLIILAEEDERYYCACESGGKEDFEMLCNSLKSGRYPEFIIETLKSDGVHIINKSSEDMKKHFPFSITQENQLMQTRIEHNGRKFGILAVTIPPYVAGEKEEQILFLDAARDIAFALYNMEMEEKFSQF